MNHGPLLFLGIFFALATSWLGMIVGPQLQFGRQQEVSAGPAIPRYPLLRSGVAREGREVYRANGCFYCHTQQIRQDGAHFDVVLASAGTNQAELIQALVRLNSTLGLSEATKLVQSAPKPVWQGLEYREAELAAQKLSVPDAQLKVVLVPLGADIRRGWGKRASVAQDYLYDEPLLVGNLRMGPDLTNIGARQTNSVWHLLHLFDPKLVAPGSTMPRYPYLFEKHKIGRQPSPDALTLSGPSAPEPGYEIVPKPETRALVAYLLSLQNDAPLFEAPLPPEPQKPDAAASTNQPLAVAAPNAAAPAPSPQK